MRLLPYFTFLQILAWSVLIAAGCKRTPEQAAKNEPYPNFIYAIQQAKPAVVHITVKCKHLFRFEEVFFGSGVIINEHGDIVTNKHLIEGASEITVTLSNNLQYDAEKIGEDSDTDLALLQVKAAEKLPYLTFGNSDQLAVGDWVLVIGHPSNLSFTITKGIVSAKNRTQVIPSKSNGNRIQDFLQVDAAINGGNSGGALVNIRGELVGIPSSIVSPIGAFIGYGLAIPSSIVQPIVNKLKQGKPLQRAILGIFAQDVGPRLIKEKQLENFHGVYVEELPTPTITAGIQKSDIIVAFNQVPIENLGQLHEQLAHHNPGDQVHITLYRDGKVQTLLITLQEAKKKYKKTIS